MRKLRNTTVRSRLTFLLAALIVVTSVVLLAISYALVNANLDFNPSSPAPTAHIPGPPQGQSTLQSAGGSSTGSPTRPVLTLAANGRQIAHHERSALLVQYAAILVILTLIAALTAWLIAGRVLRPLRTITAGARRITGERLHERLAMPGPADELKELSDTFDSMLARLEGAFQDQQLFSANAAHELRTPLGVMLAELDLALADTRSSPNEQRATLLRLRRMVIACERLTERLLSLTRGQLAPTERDPVRFDRLVEQRLALAGTAHDLTIRRELEPTVVGGDPALLGQLVENLLENAIKYNVPQGWIEIRLRTDNEQALFEIANSGHRIAEDELEGLLEPFRRATQQRVGAGNGLGLSIVRAIVDAHNGQLSLQALTDGGLRVTVTLAALHGPRDTDTGAQQRATNGRFHHPARSQSSAQGTTTDPQP